MYLTCSACFLAISVLQLSQLFDSVSSGDEGEDEFGARGGGREVLLLDGVSSGDEGRGWEKIS